MKNKITITIHCGPAGGKTTLAMLLETLLVREGFPVKNNDEDACGAQINPWLLQGERVEALLEKNTTIVINTVRTLE